MEEALILMVMMTLAVVLGRGLERKRRGEAFGWRGMLRGLLCLVLAVLAIGASLLTIWAGFGFFLALIVFAVFFDSGLSTTLSGSAGSRFDRDLS